MCFYGAQGMGLRAANLKTHCIVAAWEWRSYMSPEAFDEGIKIKISSYKRQTNNLVSRSKVNGNYVTSIMALQEAMQEGFDEALLRKFFNAFFMIFYVFEIFLDLFDRF